jgi:hypothetical protein
MAQKLPPEHTRFKKGSSGNPGGRPKLSPELKKINELTVDELKRTIAKHFRMTMEELTDVLHDPNSITLDLVICSAIAKAIKEGDMGRAEYLFMRSLGKVTEKLEVQHPEPVVIQRANGEMIALDVAKDDE